MSHSTTVYRDEIFDTYRVVCSCGLDEAYDDRKKADAAEKKHAGK